MPICANPHIQMPFRLDHWNDAPSDERPALKVKAMTAAEVDQWKQFMQEAIDATDNKVAWRKLWEAISVGVVGWSKVRSANGGELAFSEENFFAELNARECWQVGWRYPSAVQMASIDRKN